MNIANIYIFSLYTYVSNISLSDFSQIGVVFGLFIVVCVAASHTTCVLCLRNGCQQHLGIWLLRLAAFRWGGHGHIWRTHATRTTASRCRVPNAGRIIAICSPGARIVFGGENQPHSNGLIVARGFSETIMIGTITNWSTLVCTTGTTRGYIVWTTYGLCWRAHSAFIPQWVFVVAMATVGGGPAQWKLL